MIALANPKEKTVKHKVDIESIFISTCKGSLFSKESILKRHHPISLQFFIQNFIPVNHEAQTRKWEENMKF